MIKEKINIFWFRRDLRLEDNTGLYHALKSNLPLLCIFVFDKNILNQLEEKDDPRVGFIHNEIIQLKSLLNSKGGDLKTFYSTPDSAFSELNKKYDIQVVFANKDYEPYALKRDEELGGFLKGNNIQIQFFKDHVIFEKGDILKSDLSPYIVFTPYSKKWKTKIREKSNDDSYNNSEYFSLYPSLEMLEGKLFALDSDVPSLEQMGFASSSIPIPSKSVSQSVVRNYSDRRDFPALNGTSKLGVHFRFGTISIREKARLASQLNDTYLNELIWRDFYSMILQHFPHVVGNPFRKKYSLINWRNDEQEYTAWQKGLTGYPLVDAGMRELNSTGFMHNRVRMVVASFLTKHLLIDWQWGEAYFARKLLDFDLASNNGGWQWAAGCGTDAAPYFRIFNPESQQKKFDKDFKYIKKWVPEYGTIRYVDPIVDHKFARQRCLETYKSALKDAAIDKV